MRKIMFNDKYGLTEAVLKGRKTITRRIVPSQYVPMIEDGLQGAALIEAQRHGDAFREGEVVAVAQSYNMICTDFEKLNEVKCMCGRDVTKDKSWTNKMYVKPYLMPHQIKITDIKVERMQDISEADCMKEGILKTFSGYCYEYKDKHCFGYLGFSHIKDAFAALIDKVSGKGTWKRNPWVFAYSFELVK